MVNLLHHQMPPEGEDWRYWILCNGRGAGKTFAAAYHINKYAQDNPGCKMAIVAPYIGDTLFACVNGSSGIKNFDQTVEVQADDYGIYLYWQNGSNAILLGANKVEYERQINAYGKIVKVWAEELQYWPRMEEMFTALDGAADISFVITMVPKNNVFLRELVNKDNARVSHATTLENLHLPELYKKWVKESYGMELD